MFINLRSLLFVCLAMLFFQTGTYAQTTNPAIEQQARANIRARGLDEGEVRARLLEAGIDIDNVQPEQLPSLQPTIERVLDEMEAEKKSGRNNNQSTPTNTSTNNTDNNTRTNRQPLTSNLPTDTVVVQEILQDTDTTKVAVRKNIRRDTQNMRPTGIYGHQLFQQKEGGVFKPAGDVKPPDTYVLSSGDELTVSIFGPSQFDSKFTINQEGYISPTNMPKIFLKGIRLGQARELMRSRFGSFYRFAPEQFAVSLTRARTITVSIFGETNNAGSITVSAVNTAFNALAAAGGPTELGTVRNIRVIRGGQTKRLDLYEFINNPAVQYDFSLEDNDIINVPVAQRVVAVQGAVQRPYRYELIEGEQWNKLLEYAGGFAANASREIIQVKRYANDRQVLIDVNLKNLALGKSDLPLLDGDSIIIRKVSNRIENTATVAGPVEYPGGYAISETPYISDLVTKSVLRREARTDVAFLARTNPDRTVRLVQINLAAILNAPRTGVDLPLQSEDRLVIYEQSRYTDSLTINVTGAVRNAVTEYPFSPDSAITVERAILLAGGLRPDANGVALIRRSNPNNFKEKQYIDVSLPAAAANPASAANPVLQPGDELIVLSELTFSDAATIGVSGSVREPGEFAYGKEMTLRNALTLAGGFRLEASRSRIDIYRVLIVNDNPTRTVVATVQVDDKFNLRDAGGSEFILLPFDEVVVRNTPDFELQQYVFVNGEVKYPGKYALINDNETLSDVIIRAGGLSEEAFPEGTTLLRNNKGIVVTNLPEAMRVKNSPSNHILQQGDEITIPKRQDLVSIQTLNTEASKVLQPSLLRVGQINAAYRAGKRAGWYVREYAAGFSKTASRKRVVVNQPNGKINRTKNFIFFKVYPKITKGSIVIVGAKPIKKRTEGGKKIDWDKALSQILATVGVLATVIVAAAALK